MKKFLHILSIVIAVFFFASCKDDNPIMPNDNEPCYSIFVSVPNVLDTRATYVDRETEIAVRWEKGDVLTLSTGGKKYTFIYRKSYGEVGEFYHFGLIPSANQLPANSTISFGDKEEGQNKDYIQKQLKNNDCREFLTADMSGVDLASITSSKPVELYPMEGYSLLHIQAKSPGLFNGGSMLKIVGLDKAKEYQIELGEDHSYVFADEGNTLDIYVVVSSGFTIAKGSKIKFLFYAYEEDKDNWTDGNEYHYYMDCSNQIKAENKSVVKMKLPRIPTHAAIQMGLPSGIKWATRNVGATSETDYGKYFWWGDVVGYESAVAHNFADNGSNDDTWDEPVRFLKSKGILDEYYNLVAERDGATQNWGGDWRMPSMVDFAELKEKCTMEFTTVNAVKGCKVTSKVNGRSIFLPAAGYRRNTGSPEKGNICYYLSTSLSKRGSKWAHTLKYASQGLKYDYEDAARSDGLPIRPVLAKSRISVAPSDIEGSLAGEFTVDKDNGKKVKFSKGNLQYQASTKTWRFAENQYDFVGKEGNEKISPTYDGWIDLFGWGTSGWESGANAYQPWAHSINNTDYYPGGNRVNSLTGNYKEADWGVYNAISNGGGEPGLWRVFTKDEAKCILDSRRNANKLFTKATVNDIPGVILYPDFLEKPDDVTITMGLNKDRDYYENKISVDQWKILEFWGVVFLPITAYRNNSKPEEHGDGTDVVQYGEYNTDSRGNKKMTGSYWTSTCKTDKEAYVFVFKNKNDDNKISVAACERRGGCGVRLIHDVK